MITISQNKRNLVARLRLLQLESRIVPTTLDRDWLLRLDPVPIGQPTVAAVQSLLNQTTTGAVVVRDLGRHGFTVIRTPVETSLESLTPQLTALPGYAGLAPNRVGQTPIFSTTTTAQVGSPQYPRNWVLRLNNVTGSPAAQINFADLILDSVNSPMEDPWFIGPYGLFQVRTDVPYTETSLTNGMAGAGSFFNDVEPNYFGWILSYRPNSQSYAESAYADGKWRVGFSDLPGGTLSEKLQNAQALLSGAGVQATANVVSTFGSMSYVGITMQTVTSFEAINQALFTIPSYVWSEPEVILNWGGSPPPTSIPPNAPPPIAGVPWLATAADSGGGPHVIIRVDTNSDGQLDAVRSSFFAFDAGFLGGVRIATGDFDGDGIDELVTGAGPGGGPHVKIWTVNTQGQRLTMRDEFFAFDAGFRGGVWLAAGDFDHDGRDELVVAAGEGGGPHVKIYSDIDNDTRVGNNLTDQLFAYSAAFRGGVRLAVGEFRANDPMLVTAAGPGGGPHVRIYHNTYHNGGYDRRLSDEIVLDQFFAGSANDTAGLFVTAANFAGDERDELAVGTGNRVRIYNKNDYFDDQLGGPSVNQLRLSNVMLDSFIPNGTSFLGGVRVGATDLFRSDAYADLAMAFGFGGGSQVTIYSGDTGNGVFSTAPTDDEFSAFVDETGHGYDIGVFIVSGNI